MAETKTTGIVGLVPKGVWSATTQYTKLAVVRYGTGIYFAKQANINVEPTQNANWGTYWMLANSDGGDIESVTAGEPYRTPENYTATPITVKTSSGGTQTFNILAKNGNAGVQILTRSITLLSSGWTGSATPYSQTVTANGVTATSLNYITAQIGATSSELETIYNANLQDGGQADNSITVKCYGDVPSDDISLRVVIVIPSSGGADTEAICQSINTTQFGGEE